MTALITGSTSGIGEATARLLASHQVSLILCGRRQARLDALQAELSAQTSVYTLCFDVQDYQAAETALASLPEAFSTIDVLINNAGNAHGLTPVHEADIKDWDMMLDTNVKGLMYLTRLISPQMVARQQGQVINLSSIAGKEVYPNGNGYNASKFAVEAFSKATLMDLNPYGIKVTTVSPGAVETEFSLVRFKGDAERAKKVYNGFQPLTPEDVANTIWFVMNQPAHVNISDITVLPVAQASAMVLNKKI